MNREEYILASGFSSNPFTQGPRLVRVSESVHDHVGHLADNMFILYVRVLINYEEQIHEVGPSASTRFVM